MAPKRKAAKGASKSKKGGGRTSRTKSKRKLLRQGSSRQNESEVDSCRESSAREEHSGLSEDAKEGVAELPAQATSQEFHFQPVLEPIPSEHETQERQTRSIETIGESEHLPALRGVDLDQVKNEMRLAPEDKEKVQLNYETIQGKVCQFIQFNYGLLDRSPKESAARVDQASLE